MPVTPLSLKHIRHSASVIPQRDSRETLIFPGLPHHNHRILKGFIYAQYWRTDPVNLPVAVIQKKISVIGSDKIISEIMYMLFHFLAITRRPWFTGSLTIQPELIMFTDFRIPATCSTLRIATRNSGNKVPGKYTFSERGNFIFWFIALSVL